MQPQQYPQSPPPSYDESVSCGILPPRYSGLPAYQGPPLYPELPWLHNLVMVYGSPVSHDPPHSDGSLPDVNPPPRAEVTGNNEPVVTAEAVSAGPAFGPESRRIICPSCHAEVMSRVKRKPTAATHCMSLLLCLICVPCFFVPYCIDSWNNANHYCPNCKTLVGTYE